MLRNTRWAVPLFLMLATTAWAANEGLPDLDKATDARIEADTLADLENVAELCESALKKGLDEENSRVANLLLSSVLMQHANKAASAIFEQSPPDRRWQVIRQVALKDLERALKAEPNLPDAHLLIVKLQALPGGDLREARKSADAAVKLLNDDKPEQAKALVMRAELSEDVEQKTADYAAALEADPKSVPALQGRAMLNLSKGKNEEAIADLLKLVELDSNNLAAQGTLAEVLANLDKFDEALKHVDKVIELNPKSPLGYNLRARVRVLQEKLEDAVADLNEALKLDPENLGTLLLRGRVLAGLEKYDEAREDVEKALRLQPDLTQAILLRSLIAAQAKKFGQAIGDIKQLLQADPQNEDLRLQLGAYYAADNRPRKAIEIYTQLIDSDAENTQARRARADALLSIGEHAKAIEDYEVALEKDPIDSHVLNNLAWVLATSTDDAVRNGKRSIELGTKACKITKFEAPHILSTLAAGYAEVGDWETAIKWSSKAVEWSAKNEKMGEDVSEQLKEELESYKEKKPWREKQNIEENTKPLDGDIPDLEA